MYKNMILSISALFCANSMILPAQKAAVQENISIAQPLTAQENKIYQELKVKFQAKNLTETDNTLANIAILNKQETFLAQAIEGSGKSSLWPYWLGAAVGPAISSTYWVGNLMTKVSSEIYYSSLRDIPLFWLPGMLLERAGWLVSKPADIAYNVMDSANEILRLPSNTLITLVRVAPLIAFYGLYKKYSFLQSQPQELKMIQAMLATLKSFGEQN